MQIANKNLLNQYKMNNNCAGGHKNNNNKQDNVYGAVVALREFTRFIWWTQHSATWSPTSGPSRPIWAIGPPVAYIGQGS